MKPRWPCFNRLVEREGECVLDCPLFSLNLPTEIHLNLEGNAEGGGYRTFQNEEQGSRSGIARSPDLPPTYTECFDEVTVYTVEVPLKEHKKPEVRGCPYITLSVIMGDGSGIR